jgi:hypothetical protein
MKDQISAVGEASLVGHRMARKRLLGHFLTSAAAVTLLVAGGFLLAHRTVAPSSIAPQQLDQASPSPSVEGLSIPDYDSNGDRCSLPKVGKCQVRDKRTGLFGIVSVKMAEMSNVSLEVGPPPDGSASDHDSAPAQLPQLVDLFKEIPHLLRWNDVEYFEIQGIKVAAHDPAGAAYTIEAAKLSPLPRGQFMLEDGVELTHEGSGRQLTTDQVVWWPTLGVYAVPGAYTLRMPGHIRKARHTLFDTKLEPINDEKEIQCYEQCASAATFGSQTE